MKASFFSRICLIVCSSLTLCSAAFAENGVNKPLRVGVVLPLTGDFAVFGDQARQGIELALEDINASGGRKVELLFEDDKCLPKNAHAAFVKLANLDKVDVILGPACSGAVLTVAPLTERFKIDMLALLDAGEQIASAGPRVYALGFDSEEAGYTMAERMHGQGIHAVSVLFETDQWAQLVKNAFINKFTSLGGKILTEEEQNIGDSNYRPIILRLLRNKPDAMYVVPAYNGGHFLKQLRDINTAIAVYGPDTFGVNEVVEIAGSSAEGTTFTNAYLNESAPAARALRSRLAKSFGKAPTSLLYSAIGFDGLRIVYRALSARNDFAEAISELRIEDGVIATAGFDANGLLKIPIAVFKIQNGKFVPAAQ